MIVAEWREKKLVADLVVIPAVKVPDDKNLTAFLRDVVGVGDGEMGAEGSSSHPHVLSVCEGARVIGEASLFQSHKITTFASAVSELARKYPKYNWVRNTRVVVDRNVISTAGVSAAVEGALTAILILANEAAARKAASAIRFDLADLLMRATTGRIDMSLNFTDKLQIFRKLATPSKDGTLGFLLHNGIDELTMAAGIDAFNRTFPKQLRTFAVGKGGLVWTKFGLVLAPTYDLAVAGSWKGVDEWHVFSGEVKDYFLCVLRQRGGSDARFARNPKVGRLFLDHHMCAEYPFHWIYKEMESRFGVAFATVVMKLLDFPDPHLDRA
ncbi:hypothetical protein HK104_008545 [Borealophlyctis nickersoniae]|nr:hypothetical protein HK104_008545 [Borealophlyctis nickersoniae]